MTCVQDETVFVFSGMGPQWFGMGGALYRCHEAFRSAVDAADELCRHHMGGSVRDAVICCAPKAGMVPTRLAQPANLLLQIGLVAALNAHGRTPKAVIGHSIGEFAAAHTAGAISLDAACKLAVLSGAVQDQCVPQGAMLSAHLSPQDARRILDTLSLDGLSIAATNGPASVTICGPEPDCDMLSEVLADDGTFHAFLNVTTPFHHPSVAHAIEAFAENLGAINPRPSRLPIYSTVTGGLFPGPYDARYWVDNLTGHVRFCDASAAMLNEGYRSFVHIGAHAVLRTDLSEIAACQSANGFRQIATMTKEHPEQLVEITNTSASDRPKNAVS